MIALILLLIFITLKLTNNIDWNWWWVLAPLWINIIFLIIKQMIKDIINYK